MNADFPRIITLIRKERKISQKQAAADLGIHRRFLPITKKASENADLNFYQE